MLIAIGDSVSFTKTITEDDVAAFVAISGDDYEAHTDDAFMARSSFGKRIVHGALLVGLMSAAGTRRIRLMQQRGDTSVPVALGYDRLRFTAPAFIGDAVTVTYRVTGLDPVRLRSTADLIATNQTDATVAVGEHVMKWLAAPEAK